MNLNQVKLAKLVLGDDGKIIENHRIPNNYAIVTDIDRGGLACLLLHYALDNNLKVGQVHEGIQIEKFPEEFGLDYAKREYIIW